MPNNLKLAIWTDIGELYLFYVSEINSIHSFIHQVKTFVIPCCTPLVVVAACCGISPTGLSPYAVSGRRN